MTVCKAGQLTVAANMLAMTAEGVGWVTLYCLIVNFNLTFYLNDLNRMGHLVLPCLSSESDMIKVSGGMGGCSKGRPVQGLLHQPGQVTKIINYLRRKTFQHVLSIGQMSKHAKRVRNMQRALQISQDAQLAASSPCRGSSGRVRGRTAGSSFSSAHLPGSSTTSTTPP